MEFETNKWYIYKKYMIDTYVPLCWDDYLLEFDTYQAAEDFIDAVAIELEFDFSDIVIDNVAYFKTETPILNATYLRIRAGVNGEKDELYDIRGVE